MDSINPEIAKIRSSMLFLAVLKVTLLFIGSNGVRISGVDIEITQHFDRIIFLVTMVLGWKIVYFLYAATSGPRGLIEATNHVISMLFAFLPLIFSGFVFFLAYGLWSPVWNDFFMLDMWAYRSN